MHRPCVSKTTKTIKGQEAYHAGHWAEAVARWFLRLKGYRILKHNVRVSKMVGASEIDIVARKGEELVFVEVKKRPTFDLCAEAITPRVQRRFVRSADLFLAHNSWAEKLSVRFDLIWVAGWRLRHIKDAVRGE